MLDNLAQLANNLPDDVDAALITSGINRRYYLSFPSSAGTVLLTRGQNYFIIDSRYHEVAQLSVKNCEVILQDKLYDQLAALLKKHGIKTLALEGDCVTLSEWQKYKEKLPDVEILADDRVSKLIVEQRSVKSQTELDNIAAAQEITDKTFSHILNFIAPGRTELEIAIEMEQFSRRIGSEGPAFSFIVAAGPNSSRPHAVPSENPVKSGDFIVLDFGASKNGYCSDMTRTVAVGAVSEKQHEVYDLVLKAQLAALAVIKAGAVCCDIDKAARDLIDASPYKGLFDHGLGHSVGLEIHEDPRFSRDCREVLKPGVVMTVEPGVYLPGEFGVRIEDMVAATGEGCRNFTKSAKELTIL